MSQIENLEISLEHAKSLVARRDMALKLAGNRAFKTIILDGYLKDEAVRLVGLSADPSVAQHKEEIMLEIQAISLFKQFMQKVVRMGNIAAASIGQHEEELELARREENEEA